MTIRARIFFRQLAFITMGLGIGACTVAPDPHLQRAAEALVPAVRLFDSAGAIKARYPTARFEEYRGLSVELPRSAGDFPYLLYRFKVTEAGVSDNARPTEVWAIADSSSAPAAGARADSTLRRILGTPTEEGCAGASPTRRTQIGTWRAGRGSIVLQTSLEQNSGASAQTARLYILPCASSTSKLFPKREYQDRSCP
jgi:hypothetical protein